VVHKFGELVTIVVAAPFPLRAKACGRERTFHARNKAGKGSFIEQTFRLLIKCVLGVDKRRSANLRKLIELSFRNFSLPYPSFGDGVGYGGIRSFQKHVHCAGSANLSNRGLLVSFGLDHQRIHLSQVKNKEKQATSRQPHR
jgi:hypothetical protein